MDDSQVDSQVAHDAFGLFVHIRQDRLGLLLLLLHFHLQPTGLRLQPCHLAIHFRLQTVGLRCSAANSRASVA